MSEFIESELEDFGRLAYSKYDSSHDWNHALSVFHNTIKLIEKLPIHITTTLQKSIRFTSILHDTIDSKYLNEQSITRSQLNDFLIKHLGEDLAEKSMWTIENMSWSKRGHINCSSFNYDVVLFNVVRDSDWIEAIDIQRCIDYNNKINGKYPQDVLKHCDEKLLIISDNLHYNVSKQLANPKNIQLQTWINLQRK